MKTSSKGMGAVLMAFLFLGLFFPVLAEEGKGSKGDGHRKEWKGGPMGRMGMRLGLSEEQSAKLKDLFKAQREEAGPLREAERIDRDKLRLKVDSKASDGDIRKTLEDLSADRKKLEVSRGKLEEKLAGILTPTQRAKWVLGAGAFAGREGMAFGKGRGMGKMGREMGHGRPAPQEREEAPAQED